MEHLNASFRLRHATQDGGTFSGIASVFGNLVNAVPQTRIMRGAFANTLRADRDRVKILYQHDVSRPIGLPIELRETDEGLFVKAQLGAGPLAQEVRQNLKPLPGVGRPILDALSIGFDPVKWTMVQAGSEQVREVTELRLWEISVVTWGADARALIREAASRHGCDHHRELLAATSELLAAGERELRASEARSHHRFVGRRCDDPTGQLLDQAADMEDQRHVMRHGGLFADLQMRRACRRASRPGLGGRS